MPSVKQILLFFIEEYLKPDWWQKCEPEKIQKIKEFLSGEKKYQATSVDSVQDIADECRADVVEFLYWWYYNEGHTQNEISYVSYYFFFNIKLLLSFCGLNFESWSKNRYHAGLIKFKGPSTNYVGRGKLPR